MTAAALKSTPVPRTAAGEPPLGRNAEFFTDDQGEIFEHDNPRYRSPSTKVGILELDNGGWLCQPPSFHIGRPQHATREAALRAGIAALVRRARKYIRNGEGEGTRWDAGYAGRVIEWALSLNPGRGRAPAAPRAEEITDSIVRALCEARRARKVYPAGHTFSMTNPIINGEMVTMGTCSCGKSFSYKWGSYERMDAAIEAHWQTFDHLPEKVDGRGNPIAPESESADQADKLSRRRGKSAKERLANGKRAADNQVSDGVAPSSSDGPAPSGDAGPPPADAEGAGSLPSTSDTGLSAEASASQGTEAGGQPASDPAPVLASLSGAGEISPAQICAGSSIPEPAEVIDPGSGISGGPKRPEMDMPQSGEIKAGATAKASASALRSPALLAPGDPASVEGVSGDARLHAPPALHSDDDDINVDWPSYDAFIEDKIVTAPLRGIEVPRDALHPYLKPHCKDLVVWSLRLGCAAIFASFGLHKTAMQLEWCRQLVGHTGSPSLCVVPLGVRHGFIKEAQNLGMDVRFVRTTAEFDDLYCEGVRYFLTNYESIREGKLDPNLFVACSLDEASVLRSYGSKTFQEFLPLFSKVEFKLVATATPSPNRYKELIHYSGFLGVMDTGLALTRFFQRNSEKAGDLTLYPHKADEFWMWVHSWAAFLQKPSELGYSDDGYELPPLTIRWHEVPADHSKAEPERDGQGVMFRDIAKSLSDAAKSRRDSLPARVAKMLAIVAEDPDAHRLIWHDLEAEREAIEDALPSVEYGHWGEFRDGNPYARALYDRHYSARAGRDSDQILGPGEKLILLTPEKKALFGWRKFKDDSGQRGVNCAVFRNEGDVQSSDLIKEAMAVAWLRWPGERFYTFVDADEVASANPGYCFLMAGWRRCGKTQGGLDILEALPGCEVPDVVPRVALSTITGSMDIDAREQRLHDFEEGRTKYFGTKPILSGSGSNFQYHCHKAIYLSLPGYGYKFNDFIQSLYRLQRFGQEFPVEVDIIYSEDERAGRAALEEKWALDAAMRARMSEIIAAHGLNTLPLRDALLRTIGVQRVEIRGQNFIAINNDAVAECRTWPDNSVDEIITSIPFSNHYEYSASYRDFGHTDDNGHFWSQMDFLTCELLRMLKPGRLACIHVKDRVLFGSVTGEGVPTISPFHAAAIMHYRAHGFQYMGMITADTDVVRENNQSYRLGWSENAKDSTKMGVGQPEYILLMRKRQSDRTRSYADLPVTKVNAELDGIPAGTATGEYSRARWQVDAHAHWRSDSNRLLTPEEFAALDAKAHARLFTRISAMRLYNYEAHVRIGENLERQGTLPAKFMAIAPGSGNPFIWSDINRMRTLNMLQQRKGAEQHICPLPFDIVDRLIERYSNEGELVFDPFGGLMTVPYRALLKKRRGAATELSATYFMDGVNYLQLAEEKMEPPALFDLAEFDQANTPPPAS
jgi:DNA modification methylase